MENQTVKFATKKKPATKQPSAGKDTAKKAAKKQPSAAGKKTAAKKQPKAK